MIFTTQVLDAMHELDEAQRQVCAHSFAELAGYLNAQSRGDMMMLTQALKNLVSEGEIKSLGGPDYSRNLFMRLES